jgi:hypothetical protein
MTRGGVVLGSRRKLPLSNTLDAGSWRKMRALALSASIGAAFASRAAKPKFVGTDDGVVEMTTPRSRQR